MTSEIERAYRDGKVDAKLDEHSAHLKAINGSQERTSVMLEGLSRAVDKLSDQMTGLLLLIPKFNETAEEAARRRDIEAALKQKLLDDQTFWERYRIKVAWFLGVMTVLASVVGFSLRLFGVG